MLEAADALRARRKARLQRARVLDVGQHSLERSGPSGASMSLFATRRLIDLRLPAGVPASKAPRRSTRSAPIRRRMSPLVTAMGGQQARRRVGKLDASGTMVVFNAHRAPVGRRIGTRLATAGVRHPMPRLLANA